MRRFIIDTDAASDDVVAMIMALRDESCKVEAITVVAGALPVEQGVINARVAVEVADGDKPPVYGGMTKPLYSVSLHDTPDKQLSWQTVLPISALWQTRLFPATSECTSLPPRK